VPPGDAVRVWLRMLHQDGPQDRLGMADQPSGLRVPQGLPPGGAEVSHRGERGPGRDSARQREAKRGDRGAARGAIGGAKPQHAGPDEVTQPPAERGRMDRQRQAGQAERGKDRPSGSQVGEDGQQRRPVRPPGPA
jgi:hypothetical protein